MCSLSLLPWWLCPWEHRSSTGECGEKSYPQNVSFCPPDTKFLLCTGWTLINIHRDHTYLHSLFQFWKVHPPLSLTCFLTMIKSCFFQVPYHPAKPLAIIHKLIKTLPLIILYYSNSGQPYVLLEGFLPWEKLPQYCHSECTAKWGCSTVAAHFRVVPAHKNYSYL